MVIILNVEDDFAKIRKLKIHENASRVFFHKEATTSTTLYDLDKYILQFVQILNLDKAER